MTKRKLVKLTDILPYIKQGYSLAYIGRRIFGKSEATMYRYSKLLKQAGYGDQLPSTKGGRPPLKID